MISPWAGLNVSDQLEPNIVPYFPDPPERLYGERDY